MRNPKRAKSKPRRARTRPIADRAKSWLARKVGAVVKAAPELISAWPRGVPVKALGPALRRKLPEMVASAFLTRLESALEKNTVSISTHERRRAREIAPSLEKAARSDAWVELKPPAGRNQLLAAAASFVRDRQHEWAIVGLGIRRRRSYVSRIYVREGKKNSVDLPVWVHNDVRAHLEETAAAEVIHIHNHPRTLERLIKNALLGPDPTAFSDDREFVNAYATAAREAAEKMFSSRTVHCYVIENNRIRRYWLPRSGKAEGLIEDLLRQVSAVAARLRKSS